MKSLADLLIRHPGLALVVNQVILIPTKALAEISSKVDQVGEERRALDSDLDLPELAQEVVPQAVEAAAK